VTARIHEIVVPADHPSLAGHFPGQPVVPGVVLLDAVFAAIRSQEAFVLHAIPAAKFLRPVLPEERIELRLQLAQMDTPRWRASFQGLRDGAMVFEGSFIVAAAEPAS
jgi:3-hydroxyacyl-[acyl-carrier-protein] dehydratase